MSLLTEWRNDVSCVFARDPAARNHLEVLLTYPGVHAILMYRMSHRLWQKQWRFSARSLSFFARCLSNVDIHPAARIGSRLFIDHGAGVVIGETAEIGDDVTLYHGVTLGGTSWRQGKRHPTLANGVLVGAGAKILGPIYIGANVRVGANSVVVEDVPAACTVVGIPGKVVKVREAGKLNPYGFDLEHHLIPDPVGKAISCLLERVDFLEKQLEAQQMFVKGTQQQRYQHCELDNSVCENDCPAGQVVALVG